MAFSGDFRCVLPDESTSSKSASSGKPSSILFLQNEIIELFVDLTCLFGWPRSYGEIYGLLFLSARPLSFTDIHDRLSLSKGSVSQGLKALRCIGAIRPAQGADERRERFVAETELRELAAGFLNGSIGPQLRDGMKRVERLKREHQSLLAEDEGASRTLLERLEKLENWHRRGSGVLPIIAKFLG